MIIKEIRETQEQLYKYIENRHLNDVFNYMKTLLTLCQRPDLSSKLTTLQATYTYMTQYMLQGANDPQRLALYKNLIISLYELSDLIIDELMINESSDYLYSKRRYYKTKGGVNIIQLATNLLDTHKKYQSIINEANEDERGEELLPLLKSIENLQEDIFSAIAATFPTTSEEQKAINDLLNDEEYGVITSSVAITALMLSTLYYYKESNILTLLDTYVLSRNEEIKQRALCCALILCYIHKNRVELSDNIAKRISLFSEDSLFCRDVRNQFMQFIRSLETDKISDIFNKEIVPEIMKLAPEIKGKNGIEDISEENMASMLEINPEWERKMDESGITKRIKELNELQVDGSDVLMSTFSSLKNYPFFNKITNWIRPFTLQNSEIYNYIKKDDKMGVMLTNSKFMCNSDKYSLSLTLVQLKQIKPDSTIEDIPYDMSINEMFKDDKDVKGGISKNIATLYIQDLYRLFKLAYPKFKLYNIFKEHINLYKVAALKPIFSEEDTLKFIGEFYLQKGYYKYAQEYYEELSYQNPNDALFYQKLGYCKQMQKNYDAAIVEYEKGENIREDFWTIHHLALCYRAIGNKAKALYYYEKAYEMKPESVTIGLQYAHTLLSVENYSEALKLYYKVDFITEGSSKTWRPIAWCNLMLGKLEQAQTYFDKILSSEPLPNDYFNAAHTIFAQNRIAEAYRLYSQYLEKSGGDIELFKTSYDTDTSVLLKLNIPKEDIAIMRDMVTAINNYK